ncbi:MAG: hypothetical protein QM811_03455 [Pirellulales bacterium]
MSSSVATSCGVCSPLTERTRPAIRGDPAQDRQVARVADGDRVQRRFVLGLFREVIANQFRQPFDKRLRIAIAGGDDAVADVDDLRPRFRFSKDGFIRNVEIRPTERNTLLQIIPRRFDVLRRRFDRLGVRPISAHIGDRKLKLVAQRERGQDRRDDFLLLAAFLAVHRTRRIAQQHQIQRRPFGQDLALPVSFGTWRRQLHEHVPIVAAAMRDDDDLGLLVVDFADDFEVALGEYSCTAYSTVPLLPVNCDRAGCVVQVMPLSGSAELTVTFTASSRSGFIVSKSLRNP